MKHLLILVLVAAAAAVWEELPPSCSRPVYCNSNLLHHVQLSGLYEDSKHFVDLRMLKDENTTLAAFDDLLNVTNGALTKEQIKKFVDQYFEEGLELEKWTPPDYTDHPEFLIRIRDKNLRKFAKNINAITPTLGRKVKPEVFQNPEQFSLVPIPNGFIIPGGRFTEIYYWDTFWIIEGLMISGMESTVKGVIENLIELLLKFGHIPNGSRWYYEERSQPPLLSAMMMLYYEKTKDVQFIAKHVKTLETEMHYWLNTQSVNFTKDNKDYTLLRYFAPSAGPRPESYYEDYNYAQTFHTKADHVEFYIDIKSAAESGWDFSTRWFISPEGDNSGNLTNIHTRYILPVDMNAIFANALENTATFYGILRNPNKAAFWSLKADQWKDAIQEVLWDEQDGIWYDYDIQNQKHRRYFYPTNLSPLWRHVVPEHLMQKHIPKVLNYLNVSQGLEFPGGIPASLVRSGEQWDFPNVWPPEVSIVVNALEAMNDERANKLAFHLAQEWVRICHKGFNESGQMFEKYDAEVPGKYGGGGEYTVQAGFGWTNGVVFELLDKYGEFLTAYDSSDDITAESHVSSASNLEGLSVVPLIVTGNYMKHFAGA